jgi:hypothetical protein
MVTGHMGFGLHRRFRRPVNYVTLLREPIKRVMSHYLHEKRDPTSPTHEIIKRGHMDLKEFARYYAVSEMDNLQTRMIAGNWERSGSGSVDDAMFKQAKANLRKHFSVVGLSREFDVFYLLVCEEMGFRPRFYVRHNQARKGHNSFALDAETREKLMGYNQYDIALYHYGRDLSAELVAAQGSRFHQRLMRYRMINRLYQADWAGRRVSVRSWARNRFGG